MSILAYAGMSCDCPNCGLKPSFDWPSCWIHIRWSNGHGGAFTVFCEHCETSTTTTNVSGKITVGETHRIDKPLYNWKSRQWKAERLDYLEKAKERFRISYRGRPDVYERSDEEMAYLMEHLRRES